MEPQKPSKLLLLLLLSILSTLIFSTTILVAAQQHSFATTTTTRSALLDLRSSLSIKAKYWPIKADPCINWTGIHCSSKGEVTDINLSGLSRTRIGTLNPSFSVDSLVNFTKLISFNSSGFALPGFIPYWFGTSFVALKVLDLRSCSVTGSIPVSFGGLSSLSEFYLSDNLLTGVIPVSLGGLVGLIILDLSNNLLTGSFPVVISNLRSLTYVDVSSNYMSGSIPSIIGNLSRLQYLNLSGNSFTSLIPIQLGGLSELNVLDFSLNSLTGSLPVELNGLRSLEKMVLRDNNLEGLMLDNMFANSSKLEFVDLSRNKFDGGLPNAFFSMSNLRFLDLSANNLTGNLPNLSLIANAAGIQLNLSNNLFFGYLNSSLFKYGVIDLSNNYLQGQGKVLNNTDTDVYNISRNCFQAVQNQRSLADCTLFYTERGLIFDNFGSLSPSQSPLLPKSPSENNTKLIYILGGAFGGLGFVVVLVMLLLLVIRIYRNFVTNRVGTANVGSIPEEKNRTLHKDSVNLSGLGESYTYEQMLRYTCNFNEANLIKHGHTGDIFEGTLESGVHIIIKRVDLHLFRKEAYTMELEFFNKCSHTRLVPLLGHCLEQENEKFLVYRCMLNGDLSKSLYRCNDSEDDSIQSLDWITRLKIAIGAAEGLSYLHHECSPPLVHRDIQSSSILLDDEFEVRLGSLSEICVQGDPHQHVISKFLKTPQNSEQSLLGSSSANCAHDVYCFGKVLLELVTGKLGISKFDDTFAKEWLEQTLPHISIHDKEMVTTIIDPTLVIDEDLLEEVWAMAIVARSCLNPKPSKRPPMKFILKALESPLKVVRQEYSSSARLPTTSSRRSWSAAIFGSWRQSSSESASVRYQENREGISGLKQLGRIGSYSSGRHELSSSRKRLSSEIFPEPVEFQDVEKQAH